jgi:transcription elongation GreA/GreB family factor
MMAMQLQSYLITPDGYRQLCDELEHLMSVGRQRLADELRDLRADGDVADNPALVELLEQQSALEARIRFLSQQLGGARIARTVRDGTAGIGSFVTVRDLASGEEREYQLVAEIESDASAGRLSVEAPIGQALYGLRAADTANVEVPRGTLRLEVIRVASRPSDG